MRNFTGKKIVSDCHVCIMYTPGFAQDARGSDHDVLDSFYTARLRRFYAWRHHSGTYPAMGQYHRQGEQGHEKGKDLSHWAGMFGFALLAAVVVSAVKSAISGISLSMVRYKVRKGLESPCMIRGASFRDLLDIRRLLFRRFRPVLPRHPCGISAGATGTRLALVLVISRPPLPLLPIQAEKKRTAPKSSRKREKVR